MQIILFLRNTTNTETLTSTKHTNTSSKHKLNPELHNKTLNPQQSKFKNEIKQRRKQK